MAESRYYFVQDVMEIMEVKERKAYDIIRKFNDELNKKGIETIPGRVPKSYFHLRTEVEIRETSKNGQVIRAVV